MRKTKAKALESEQSETPPFKLGSFESNYPKVAHALALMRAGPTNERRSKDNRSAIEEELRRIDERKEPLNSVLDNLLGDVPLNGPGLLKFSLEAYQHLGSSDTVTSFMGAVWAEVIGRWSADERFSFVQSLGDQTGHDIFEVLEFAKDTFNRYDFPAEVMHPWIARVRTTIGQDLMQGGMWACIENYCRRCPAEALKVVVQWQQSDPDEQARSVIARMVAMLRLSTTGKGDLSDGIAAFDSMLSAPGSPELRSEYIESWAFMLDSALLTNDLLVSMRQNLCSAGGKEEIAWCFLLARIVRLAPTKWATAFNELMVVARPDLELHQKYWVVDAALEGWSRSNADSKVTRNQWEELFFRVQPLSEADLGAWKSIEMFLRDTLKKHPEAAGEFLLRLATTSGRTWEKLLRGPTRMHEGVTYTLKQSPSCADIITKLCLAPTRSARRVGLEWFDRCELGGLDQALVATADPALLEAVLLEAMVFPLLSVDTARLHGSLVHRIDAIGGDLAIAFYEEVEHQTMDTHGYRKKVAEACGNHARILQMVEDANKRIDATNAVRNSPALQMRVPGHQRAMELWMRRTGRSMRRNTMDDSFMSHITNITILYSNKYRMRSPDGKLGEVSELNKISAEGEMPRLEPMTPEALTTKRISAEIRIQRIQMTLIPVQL